jgi:drug/metabolite transporter (DMT)-like permease
VSEPASNPAPPPRPRGWALVAAGLLLLALALVVLYTGRGAFLSPLALLVVAAIGLAALLLRLHLRKDMDKRTRAPLWLNVLGLIFAVGAVLADFLHLSRNIMLIAALAAVVCFAVSGLSVLRSLRRQKN